VVQRVPEVAGKAARPVGAGIHSDPGEVERGERLLQRVRLSAGDRVHGLQEREHRSARAREAGRRWSGRWGGVLLGRNRLSGGHDQRNQGDYQVVGR
jgi:hypothetical protein